MATKNNLDVGGEAPHHTELADRYRIEGAVYDLTQIIAAVKGEQSNDDWDARTMGDRLDATKAYLKSVDAEKVDETENTAGDGETVRDGNGAVIQHADGESGPTQADYDELRASADRMADVIEVARVKLGLPETTEDTEPSLAEGIKAVKQQIVDIREKLKIDAQADIIEAIDALTDKASEAEQRAVAAERDASQLRGEVQRLRSASTRDKPLHGHVDDLKAPY